jgi:hypothetical protein
VGVIKIHAAPTDSLAHGNCQSDLDYCRKIWCAAFITSKSRFGLSRTCQYSCTNSYLFALGSYVTAVCMNGLFGRISVEVHERRKISVFDQLALHRKITFSTTNHHLLAYSYWAVKGAVVTIGTFVKLLLAPGWSATSKRQHIVCCSPAPSWRVPLGRTGLCSTRFCNRACWHCRRIRTQDK